MRFAIPSYNRVIELGSKTLKTLEGHGINKSNIDIFCVKGEIDEYKQRYPEYNFIEAPLGMKEVRNFIFQDYYKEGDYIVSIDDDIETIRMKNPREWEESCFCDNELDLEKEMNIAFKECEKSGRHLWGLYPVENHFFMKNSISYDYKFCVGNLWGVIVNKESLLVGIDQYEDYERCIKHYLKDGGMVRLNYLCCKTKYISKGGMGKVREFKKSQEYLTSKYPNLFILKQKKDTLNPLLKDSRVKGQVSLKHKFVINMKQSTERWNKYKNDSSFTRWPATCRDDITEEIDKRMVSMWNLPKKEHLNKCGCFMSHYRLYEHIVKNKLNDVLILEDDAMIVGDLPNVYPRDCITYLGGYIHGCKADPKNKEKDIIITNFKNGINYYDKFFILMTMSYILPTWQVAEELLDYLNTMKRWRAIDWLLCRWTKKHAALYPAVVVEEETSSTIKDKKVKTNIHYQLIKWGEDAMIESNKPKISVKHV